MAEVLITLGIIGVVAAITLPAITANIQKNILKNQLKKFTTNFYNGIKQVKVNLYPELQCYYWDVNPYGADTCTKRNEYGTCIGWALSDNTKLPDDYNGPMNNYDCRQFDNELFTNVLKVVKYCEKNALANGCLTDEYRGIDKVKNEQNPDKESDPNQIFSDTNIKNNYPVYILTDGTIIIRYYNSKVMYPIYAVDVNGYKGPNKWGYDIFYFQLIGNKSNGITGIKGVGYNSIEAGGTANRIIFRDLFSK